MAIQLTNDQETELLSMTRVVTPADEAALNQAYAELGKKGFVQSGENFMVLIRAYNQAPQVPITVENVLQFTAKYRDAFQWLSATELEFNKLSDQLGKTTTDLVIRLLGRHGLVNTPGTEDMFHNFNQVVGFYLSRGWQITADSFEKAVGNLRTSLGHGTLVYKQTPSELARQKRWDDTRASEPRKTARQLAEEKAAAVRHVRTEDGRLLSDVILEAAPDPEPTPSEKRLADQKAKLGKDNDSYWQQRTMSYINSIQSNLVRAEAEQLFGKQMNGNWEVNYRSLENWLSRKQSAGHWY